MGWIKVYVSSASVNEDRGWWASWLEIPSSRFLFQTACRLPWPGLEIGDWGCTEALFVSMFLRACQDNLYAYLIKSSVCRIEAG